MRLNRESWALILASVTLTAALASAPPPPSATALPPPVPTQHIETECRIAVTILSAIIQSMAADPANVEPTLVRWAIALEQRNVALFDSLYFPLLTTLLQNAAIISADPERYTAQLVPQVDAACVVAMRSIT